MAALENSRQDIKDTDEINLQIADAFFGRSRRESNYFFQLPSEMVIFGNAA